LQSHPKPLATELILTCQVSPSFQTTKKLETTLSELIKTSVHSFDFQRAALVLVRKGRPPVWWYTENESNPPQKKNEYWAALERKLNQFNDSQEKLLEAFNPVAYSTLPVILQAGEPVGTMEVGIFNTDSHTADYMLVKALSLGRHMADIIQESIFETHKNSEYRKLAACLEVISTINSTLDIRQVLHVVAQLTADLFFARTCIYMLDKKEKVILPIAAVGSYDVDLKDKIKALTNYPIFPAMSAAIKNKQPVIVTPQNIKKYIPLKIIKDFNYSSMIIAPIMKKDKALGIMQVDRPYGLKVFDQEETEIISAIARVTAITIENAKLIDMLGSKELLLHKLVNKIITAQEDEKKRFALDLHDGIIQSLIGIWYRLQRITRNSNKAPEEWYEEISELTAVLGEQIEDTRHIIYDLRPVILDNFGLVPAIQSYSKKMQEQHDLLIQLTLGKENVRFPSKIEITLYRIYQEVITNVIKHSGATKVQVEFSFNDSEVKLSIIDNGSGLSDLTQQQCQTGKHLGLASIRERTLLLNGTCKIDSKLGKGTRVQVVIPYEKNTKNY
jgi:signal transduction histidine kinase